MNIFVVLFAFTSSSSNNTKLHRNNTIISDHMQSLNDHYILLFTTSLSLQGNSEQFVKKIIKLHEIWNWNSLNKHFFLSFDYGSYNEINSIHYRHTTRKKNTFTAAADWTEEIIGNKLTKLVEKTLHFTKQRTFTIKIRHKNAWNLKRIRMQREKKSSLTV